jgi:hypothetical protein
VRDLATLALRWSSVSPPDVDSLPTPMLISQGRLYAQSLAGGRPSIVAYALDGCGKPTCSPVTVIDTGPGTNRLLGIGVTEGTLFFSQTGAGISACAPT